MPITRIPFRRLRRESRGGSRSGEGTAGFTDGCSRRNTATDLKGRPQGIGPTNPLPKIPFCQLSFRGETAPPMEFKRNEHSSPMNDRGGVRSGRVWGRNARVSAAVPTATRTFVGRGPVAVSQQAPAVDPTAARVVTHDFCAIHRVDPHLARIVNEPMNMPRP